MCSDKLSLQNSICSYFTKDLVWYGLNSVTFCKNGVSNSLFWSTGSFKNLQVDIVAYEDISKRLDKYVLHTYIDHLTSIFNGSG